MPDLTVSEDREAREFFGKAMASMSHELANAVGTLTQLVGLLDDLVRDSGAGKPIDPERLVTVKERLARQAGRATELIRQLNYFAHTLDGPKANVDLNALAVNLLTLSRRRAVMRGAELELRCAEDRVSVAADPYALLLSLFLALECLYEGCTGGQEIEIEVADVPARIELRGAAGPLDAAAGDQRVAAIASLVARHGGQLKRSESGGAEVLTLVP